MEKLALDSKTLKALAAETRVRILKLLDRKAMTQSEIAEETGMRLPTIGEHLKSLEDAGLVEREQTGRKWKYVSLTDKARILLHPNAASIWFVLGFFLFSVAACIWYAARLFSPFAAGEGMAEAKMLAASMAEAEVAAVAWQSPVPFVFFCALAVLLLFVLVWLLRRHGWLGRRLSNRKNL